MSSSRSTSLRPAAFAVGGQLAEQQQRGDAVLVLHVLGVDAVAERLLVAERQPLDPADPLEAGERLGVRLAGGRRHLPEQARRHDAGRVGALLAAARAGRARAARRPRRRAASASRAGRGRRPRTGRRPGRWRPRGRRRGRSASAIARSIAPGLLRVGERDGREVRVRVLLLLDDGRRGEARGLQHPLHRRTADAVQRRVDDVEVARAVAGELGDGVEVACRRGPRRAPCRRCRAARRRAGRPPRSGAAISASAGGTIWLPSPR